MSVFGQSSWNPSPRPAPGEDGQLPSGSLLAQNNKFDFRQSMPTERSVDESDRLTQLAIITCHFNPVGYNLTRRNYWQWRHSLGSLQRLLVTAELSFDGHFMIADAMKLHGRPEHRLWQKEAMINAVVRALPSAIQYVAWIDHDLVFESIEWAEQAIEMLEDDHAVVQLFDSVRYTHADDRPHYIAPGAVWKHEQSADGIHQPGQPGGAWAARRDYFESIGGLLPAYVLGGGDRIASDTWLNVRTPYWGLYSPALKDCSCRWADRAYRELGDLRIGFVPGRPNHLYHGKLGRRNYRKRTEILVRHDYDPVTDIRMNRSGLAEWCSNKPELHREVTEYFAIRQEDD